MNDTVKQILISLLVAGVVALAIIWSFPLPDAGQSIGSVSQASEYQATSTAGWANVPSLLKTEAGTLGSVVITGANTAPFHLYDATTTNQGLRAASQTTSTITLASFPASAVVGTYTFDRIFFNGLLVQYSGTLLTNPTSTITWR